MLSVVPNRRLSSVATSNSPFEPASPVSNNARNINELFSEEAPVLSLGERVVWIHNGVSEFGLVRWIGRMPQVCPTWTVGVEFVSKLTSLLFSLRSTLLYPLYLQIVHLLFSPGHLPLVYNFFLRVNFLFNYFSLVHLIEVQSTQRTLE